MPVKRIVLALVRRFGLSGGLVIAGRLVQLALFYVIAHRCSVQAMGLFVATLAASQLVGTFSTLGLGAAAQRIVPEALARGRRLRVLVFLRGLGIALLGVTSAILLALISGSIFGQHFGIKIPTDQLVGLLIFIPSFSLSINRELISRAFGEIFLAFAPRDIIWSAVIICSALIYRFDETSLLIWSGIALLGIESIASLFLYRNHISSLLSAARGRIPSSFPNSWIKKGMSFAASSLGGQGFERLDTLFIAATMNLGSVAIYGLCSRIAPIASISQRFVVPVLLNSFSSDFARGNISGVRKNLALGVLASIIFSAPMLIGVMLFSEDLLRHFGSNYEHGASALKILVVAHVTVAIGSNFGALILTSRNPGHYGRVIWVFIAACASLLVLFRPSDINTIAYIILFGIAGYNLTLIAIGLRIISRARRAQYGLS